MKTCKLCLESKPLEEFASQFAWYCNTCLPKAEEIRRRKNSENASRWYRNNKDRHTSNTQRSQYKNKYGITRQEVEDLLTKQEDECAICHANINPGFHIDHDHVTGKVRGLLCKACNLGLGHFQDDTKRLDNAVNYLRSFS